MGATFALGGQSYHLQELKRRIAPGMTVYDVGANCGQLSLLFSRAVGPSGHVVSFEPVEDNAQRLARNLQLNGCRNVRLLRTAVGATAQPRMFRFDAAAPTQGTFDGVGFTPSRCGNLLKLPCDTLDNLMRTGLPAPDLLKIDVEGAGKEVLDGAQGLLQHHRPLIFFEVHAPAVDSPELLALGYLRDELGYRIASPSGAPIRALTSMWAKGLWCEPNSAPRTT